jgi:hypothetical protein
VWVFFFSFPFFFSSFSLPYFRGWRLVGWRCPLETSIGCNRIVLFPGSYDVIFISFVVLGYIIAVGFLLINLFLLVLFSTSWFLLSWLIVVSLPDAGTFWFFLFFEEYLPPSFHDRYFFFVLAYNGRRALTPPILSRYLPTRLYSFTRPSINRQVGVPKRTHVRD